MYELRSLPLLIQEAQPALSAYPEWTWAMTEGVDSTRASWVARHDPTGLIVRGMEDYTNFKHSDRVVGLRSACCGVGLMPDAGAMLCLDCKTDTKYRADTLQSTAAFDELYRQAYWWNPYLNPLESVLKASELSELAHELEAKWQARLPA